MIKIGIYTVLKIFRKGVDCICQKTPHTLFSDIKKHKDSKISMCFFIINLTYFNCINRKFIIVFVNDFT